MASEKSTALDLAHHLSALSNARQPSPLKGLQKYLGADILSLAGGMPDPSLFPFAAIAGDALVPQPAQPSRFSWFWNMFGAPKTQRLTVPKYPAQPGDINLAQALQYSPATGLSQLQEFVRTFTGRVHAPVYDDWATLVDIGNTDGIYKAVATLCNPGERVLVEEWTYPSFIAAAAPMNVRPAPVKVDGEGLSSTDLERVLATWDEAAQGAKRPHVLYTVPIGQNPTGATMGLARKQAVYAVCVKYDVVIIEDDPYYFLQEGTWRPKAERARAAAAAPPFLAGLAPSFLRVDTQGRVLRLDSFSKIIAPGARMGWFTGNPRFVERLERQGEATTQAPSGFAQALVAQLVARHWGPDTFLVWLQQLQAEYTARRDFFVDALFAAFDVRRAARVGGAGPDRYTAFPRAARGASEKRGAAAAPLFSFVPPSSGMFVWLEFHVRDAAADDDDVETRLWTDLAEHGLLVVPGNYFAADPTVAAAATAAAAGKARMRISFSMGKHADLQKGVDILARVLDKWAAAAAAV